LGVDATALAGLVLAAAWRAATVDQMEGANRPIPAQHCCKTGRPIAAGSKEMWRLAFVLYLLSASIALARESTGQIHVGFTIIGNGKTSTTGSAPATVATGNMRGPVPLPPQRPAAIGRSDTDLSTR
jgi:hypothetical protein